MNNQCGNEEMLLYVGSYALQDESSIHLCKLHLKTGRLELIDSISGILNPSFLAVNQAASSLYAVSESAQGAVYAYAIDPDNGRLSELGKKEMDGADPCYLTVSSTGYVLIAHYSSGHLNSFSLDSQGELVEMVAQIQHVGSSGAISDRQESAHAHSIVVNEEGTYAYVSDLGQDKIVIYRLVDGKLQASGHVELPPGSGPRHFVIQESGNMAYGINELNNSITAYKYNSMDGSLETIQHVSTLPEGFAGESYPADIHLSPDGRYIYGSNRGHDSIVRFAIDSVSGLLSEPVWSVAGGKWPRNFAVLEDFVLVANQNSNNIAVFKRDGETGRLTATGNELELDKPVCIEPLKVNRA